MGAGGSRYGAGRPGWRRRCEQQLKIDIRQQFRKGNLLAGQHFNWHWNRDDERIAEVGAYTEANALTLRYTWTPYGYGPRSIVCRVGIERTPCHFGGDRVWFVCPDCNRRCAVIYGVSRYGNFACRVCRRLGYQSESESPIDRCWRQQRKIEAKLAEDGHRPRGMRMRTFERLCAKWDALEERKDALWWPQFASLARRLGMDPDEMFS